VIVVPACPDYRPVPSLAFLAAVERYLDRRRPLTTEVHVRAPCYTEVGVSATLCTDGLASKADVDADATAAITRFFHPLEGGPEGTGWPIGRSVYRSEVMALLASVRGVTSVSGLGLRREGESGPECGNVKLVLYSENELEKGDTRVVDSKVLEQISQDFAPYRAGR